MTHICKYQLGKLSLTGGI